MRTARPMPPTGAGRLLVYHAWEKTFTKRQVWIDEVAFEHGKPVVKGPDVGPQPKP